MQHSPYEKIYQIERNEGHSSPKDSISFDEMINKIKKEITDHVDKEIARLTEYIREARCQAIGIVLNKEKDEKSKSKTVKRKTKENDTKTNTAAMESV